VRHPLITTVKIQDYLELHEYVCSAGARVRIELASGENEAAGLRLRAAAAGPVV